MIASLLMVIVGDVGVLDVVVDGKACGSALVALDPGPVAVEAAILARCGLLLDDVERTSIDGTEAIEVAALGPMVLDLERLSLHFDALPSRWPVRDLDRAASSGARLDEEAPSFHLDYAPRATTTGALELTAEAGARAWGWALSGGVYASNVSGVMRGLTRLTYDHQPALLRVVIGDETTSAASLGGAAVIGGVTLRRTGALDPQRSRGVSLAVADVADSPSELEVYVNDSLVRRVRVDPGPFRLDDIVQPAGPGQVRYVLRDAYGGERSVVAPYFSVPGLLRAGEHEFVYSAGLVRDMRAGEAWSYRRPALVGHHRFGASRQLTLGVHLEASPLGARGGPSFLTGVASGTLELALGLATHVGGPGVAGQVTYMHPTERLSWSLFARAASPGYSVEPLSTEDPTKAALGASVRGGGAVSLAIAQWSMSLDATASAEEGRPAVGSVRVGGAGLLVDALSLYGGGRLGTDATWEITAGVRWSIDGLTDASVEQTALAQSSPTTGLRVDRRVAGAHGWGASGRVMLDQRSGDVAADASARVETRWGRAAVRGAVSPTRLDGAVELSGSLVAVWGGGLYFAAHRPQGYAVVEVPDQPGVRVYLDQHEVGVTDEAGQILVLGLRPYETSRLSIAQTDVSLDAMLEASEVTLTVPPRGATLLRFPVRYAQYVRGVVRLGGQPLRWGQLTASCGEARPSSPLGSEGSFELDTPPHGVCTFVAQSEDRRCRGSLLIEGGGALLDLGSVDCREDTP